MSDYPLREENDMVPWIESVQALLQCEVAHLPPDEGVKRLAMVAAQEKLEGVMLKRYVVNNGLPLPVPGAWVEG
jgi:hypothetical protein